MNIEEINKEASGLKVQNLQELSDKILELKINGVSFLGCIYFVQMNQQISLLKARELTFNLDAWAEDEKSKMDTYYKLMMSEYEESEEQNDL